MKRSPSVHQLIYDAIAEKDPESAQAFNAASRSAGIADDRQAVTELNRYWRVQLGLLPQSTIDQRECLVDGIDFEDWFRDFKNHVLPTIVLNRLPLGLVPVALAHG